MSTAVKRARTFKIFTFNEKTRQVEVVMKLKTKPITEERLHELARQEVDKCNSPACYKVEGRP